MSRFDDRFEQRHAVQLLPCDGQHVVQQMTARVDVSIHLFAARPRGLMLRAFTARAPSIFLQLVDAVQIRCVGRCADVRADAVGIDRRAALMQRFEPVFVEVAAREDLRLLQSARIENGTHAPRVFFQVAAIDPYATNFDPVSLETMRERDHLAGAGLGVVRVDQQRIIGLSAGECLERI